MGGSEEQTKLHAQCGFLQSVFFERHVSCRTLEGAGTISVTEGNTGVTPI